MSFFFDVWNEESFVLVSDVRLLRNGSQTYAHKVAAAHPSGAVTSAIATCGDYCERSLELFTQATAAKDTLRDIASDFAHAWTERYAGTEDYSAAHIVGYEKIHGSHQVVPQMWYWANWDPDPPRFLTDDELSPHLKSFDEHTPFNNHIPTKIEGFSAQTLDEERVLVQAFLRQHQPVFTWNGDRTFWGGAGNVVQSVFELLRPETGIWDADNTWEIAKDCLEFLARVGSFRNDSTVGLSPEEECDVLVVTPAGVERKMWSKLPDQSLTRSHYSEENHEHHPNPNPRPCRQA
jgi:hypothetical protein